MGEEHLAKRVYQLKVEGKGLDSGHKRSNRVYQKTLKRLRHVEGVGEQRRAKVEGRRVRVAKVI